MDKYKRLAVLAAFMILAGCAVVSKDETGISIRHSSENDLLIQQRADRHCAFFGKTAVKVQEGSRESTYFVGTRVSTFKCVKENG
ncbi:MAG: hypothetical protein JJ900_06735 [Rhodospirillales bacterium]|nr:hypothetical protein [Rhodospirillales bacterium]MBO6786532.1 hypothetical protein [Rhodospirillales bacterium]